MRNRKFTDGVRSSARQKSRNYTSDDSFVDEEEKICRSTKSVCLASTHKMDRRPSKQSKCERNSVVKLEIQELVSKSRDAPLQKRPTEARNDLQRLEETPDSGMMSRSKGRRIPTLMAEGAVSKENAAAVATGCTPKLGDCQQLIVGEESCLSNGSHIATEEDSSDGHSLTNETKGAACSLQTAPIHVDISVFMDEDSNQPMPLGRFFENADLMQEIPPVVPAYSSMSRREFRKLHFKAKEDDDDDDDEENS
ncbi:UPF0688 protein C1orf174 homolog isoform X2 [Ambystoma mexicanum]|uniref:UPF0688 protein C1orf174 homolog isoform X2 n=1 Tax=Ambystoma mexicanum TaxID=8296 RepID=UPI0037E78BE2